MNARKFPRRIHAWLTAFAVALAGGLTSASAVPLGVFPEAVLEGGWAIASPAEHFDTETIFNKIDGAADQFIQYGLKQADFLSLRNEAGLEIMIERYDMAAFENALGLFAAQRGKEKRVERQGGAWWYAINPGAIGFSGSIYFKVVGNKPDAGLQEKAVRLIGVLDKSVSESALPATFTLLLEQLKVPFEGISFEKNDAFQYHFAREFWFGKARKEEPQRWFLHEAKRPEEAGKLRDQLLENFLFDFDLIKRLDTGAILKHKYLKTFTQLEALGVWVFGVEGAPDESALASASQAITAILPKAGK